ncbi:hypothetical protein K1719_042765 [Acacia pycnantha]|nr:hypothetical protein K1719_042765 [Acacia pycnantha]
MQDLWKEFNSAETARPVVKLKAFSKFENILEALEAATFLIEELIRGVRNRLNELITSLPSQDIAPLSLCLSHSLSRYKLKFRAYKVDTMIVQAIVLLDDSD